MVQNCHKTNLSYQEIRALCGEYLGAENSHIKKDGTAWIVSKAQGDSVNKVVLKIVEESSIINSASEMSSLHEKVRCAVNGEGRSIVPILGYDDESNSIVMDYVNGFPLLKLLQRVLFTRIGKAEASDALDKAGRILADINAIREEDVNVKTQGRSNDSYVEGLIRISKDKEISDCLANGHQDIIKFINGFSNEWKERSAKQLIAVDVQPKNVFVSGKGIVLIDPDYAIGNPAMNIAQVLVSIDQLGMKFPFKGHNRIIEEWKNNFLSAYKQSKNAYEWVEEDLTFFYPWALLQSYIRHIGYRPMLSKYFARWYGGRVGRFVCSKRLQKFSSA